MDTFEAYFQKADLDRDGRISGAEAVAFLKGANLPQPILAKVWQAADRTQQGFLSKADFINALKLVTVAQSGRELTPEIVRAALEGPAASKIPAPRITSEQVGYGGSLQPAIRPSLGGPVQGQMQPQVTKQVANSGNTQGILSPASSGFGTESWPPLRPPVAMPQLQNSLGSSQQTPVTQPVQGKSLASSQGLPGTLLGSTFQPVQDAFKMSSPAAPTLGTQMPLPSGASRASFVPPASSVGSIGSAFSGDSFMGNPPVSAQIRSSGSGVPAMPLQNIGNQTQAAAKQPLPKSVIPTQGPKTSVANLGSSNQWPKMSEADVQRYNRIFAQVDTDRDGKITGIQARDLFLRWGLPREVLKQVWDLSDEDSDSMLSLREFCTAVYFMERYREGRPLPPVLPAGFHHDGLASQAWNPVTATRIAEAQVVMAQHSAGHNLPSWQRNPGLLHGSMVRPVGPGRSVPPSFTGQIANDGNKSRAHPSNQRNKNEKDFSQKKPQNDVMALEIMDSKEKMEYYRSKLQEIVLFKSRCDNRLAEMSDRASANKLEVESLAKKYDEKYKQTAEINSRLLSEETTYRGLQDRKMELLNAIAQIEQGGNANALLQTRADRISADLDELEKALCRRAQHLGLELKTEAPPQLPFGWEPGMQENVVDWDEDWDKFDDDGYSVVQDIMDDPSKPIKANGINWDDQSIFGDEFDFSTDPLNEGETSWQNDGIVPSATIASGLDSPRAESEAGSVKSGESPQHDLWSPRAQLTRKSMLGNMSLSSRTSERSGDESQDLNGADSVQETNSYDETPAYDTSDIHDEKWRSVFTMDHEDDVRASWGLQTNPQPNMQMAHLEKSMDSLDLGTLHINGHKEGNGIIKNEDDFFAHLGTKEWDEKSRVSHGELSMPETPLFTTAAEKYSPFFIDDDDRRASFSRYDSVSVRDGDHEKGNELYDDDPFADTGPFGGKSSQWSTF